MDAVVICRNLKNKLPKENSLRGKVHSIFKNACNLITDEGDMFITLLSSDKIMSPMSIMINTEEYFDFRACNIKQNMGFQISNFEVFFHKLDMHITFNGAKEWKPEFDFTANPIELAGLKKNIKTFENGLFSKGRFYGMETIVKDLSYELPELEINTHIGVNSTQQKQTGMYGLNNYDFISERFRIFIKAFIQGDMEDICENCKKIIGFGSGLTPSMDDFLNGLMITNFYMGKYNQIPTKNIYTFNSNIVGASLEKTTKISSEMLKNGILGHANDAVKGLMEMLLFSNKTVTGINKELMKAIEAVVDYGETSGTDTALGIYVGLKIWTNYDYRRVMLNGFMCRN